MKVSEFAPTVLAQREEDGIRGIARERSRYRVHIATAGFIDMDVEDVEPKHIAAWWREMRKKKPLDKRGDRLLAEATIERSKALVRVIFREAVTQGLRATNPCTDVRLPKRADEESNAVKWAYFTLEEQHALATCETIPLADRVIIRFAMGTGLRQGEVHHLRLEDLHVEGPEPHVLVRTGSKGYAPKSRQTRTVPLFGMGLDAAREWLTILPTFARENPEALAFPTVRGHRRPSGKPFGRSAIWHGYLRSAGVKRARFHDLRHTCASSLLCGWWGRKWSIVEVRDMLGHSSVTVTERYAHLADTALKAAARETASSPALPAVPPAPESRPKMLAKAIYRAVGDVLRAAKREA